MATESRRRPIVFIVGPTASGKTALAIELAQQVGGEIIAADSRTIYKGMDIGTAKPSKAEQAAVPHWGLDLVEPGERFTAADFKAYALTKIDEILGRGHVPFIVGGTGLYVDAVLFDYQFGPEPDPALRAELEQLSIEELQERSKKSNIELPENSLNKRHLIRSIEQQGLNTKRRTTPVNNAIVVGIATNSEQLKQRIQGRSEQLFEQGMVEEAKMLGKKYGWQSEAMTANIYRLVHEFEQGGMSEQELKARNATSDWQLAKRQLTWLKRNPFIHWLGLTEAKDYVVQSLVDK
jgi:tRNA dimethylallyltransferase